MIRKIIYFVALFLISQFNAYAHEPHDIIYSVDLSPAFSDDQTLFYSASYDLMGRLLLKSTDGGRTRRIISKGLDIDFDLSSIAVSPSYRDDHTVFVTAVGDSIYRSIDSGSSWVNVSSGSGYQPIKLLAPSPNYNSDGIMFAVGDHGGFYKSADRGINWKLAIGSSINVSAVSVQYWKGNVKIFAGQYSLYVSSDLGASWKWVHDFSKKGSSITAIEFSPGIHSPGEVFVGTDKGGMYRSKDGGRTFKPINDGITDPSITSIAISPEYKSDGTLFCSTWHEGVFCSTNKGKSWRKFSEGLVTAEQAERSHFRRPQFSMLKISKYYGTDKTLFLAGYCGLFKSTDGGNHWTELESWWPKAINGFAISPAFAQDSTLAVATQYDGAYISQDRGKTWKRMNEGLALAIDRHLLDIQFSPAFLKDKTLFSVSDSYLLECTITERRWRKHNFRTGPPYTRSPFLTTITPSPKYHSDHTLYVGTRSKGVFVSNESGFGWRNVFGVESTATARTVTCLVLSPEFPSDRTVYAGFYSGENGRVYKSTDGGQSWKPLCYELLFGRLSLALSPKYRKDHTLYVGGNGGLLKSVDGGDHFFEIPVSLTGGNNIINAIGLSPAYHKDKTLIVSLKGKGLFLSADGGAHFSQVGLNVTEGQPDPGIIRFSPQYNADRTVYAVSLEEIFMSVDGGRSWSALSWATESQH